MPGNRQVPAGRPALAVLQGSGLGDVTVVVTRYFGGTKLGTGELLDGAVIVVSYGLLAYLADGTVLEPLKVAKFFALFIVFTYAFKFFSVEFHEQMGGSRPSRWAASCFPQSARSDHTRLANTRLGVSTNQ